MSKKAAAKTSPGGVADESRQMQAAWARELASDIEGGGALSTVGDRAFVAAILRGWAAQLESTTAPKGRGNPNLKKKHSPIDAALLAYGRIDIHDQKPADVFVNVGEMLGIDDSTVAKAYRKHRPSIAETFPMPTRRNSKE